MSINFIFYLFVSSVIVTILVYFFCKNIIAKVIIFFTAVPILTISFILIFPYINMAEFDSVQWKTNKYTRYDMAKTIVKNKILIGKTKEDIFNILGKDFEQDGVNMDTIFYPIGDQYVSSYLYIKFKNNKVMDVGILQD